MDGDGTLALEVTPVFDFPIVGIGASAGGLEAVTTMFHNVEVGTGMAYVLVMHLDPDHESLMAELLSRKTHVNVRQIKDNDTIEVDCLHVIPPGSSLSIEGNRFRLDAFSEPRGLRRPIDSFFVSLAETQGEKAACVVLSGTGADGTAGLRAIKELGGVAAVQTPEEARYDGMPFSAISTKQVDFVLSAREIVTRLASFFHGAMTARLPESDERTQRALNTVFEVLRGAVGNDFSGYKQSTLLRRLSRRMQVLEYSEIEEYVWRLQSDVEEQVALAQDFLINVTSFFRDRENFEIMRRTVIAPLIENAEASDEVRIWIPGCSSGQEAYSIAMMVDETCEELQRRPLIQIFATDIDEVMIAHARRAQYPVAVFGEIPRKYQDQYTVGLDGKFEIVSKIREMVRFSVHNLIQDPPFSKIDLISCRNLLIYLGDELQTNLFPLLHFSLRQEGHLFLGTSENVTRRGELFFAVDQRARIFKRQNVARRGHLNLPLASGTQEGRRGFSTSKMAEERDFPRHQSLDATNASLYEQYAPPFVRVTADGRIIDSSGDLSLFMMSRPGEERTLHNLARDGIRDVVLPLLPEAVADQTRRALKDVEIVAPFGSARADIVVHPMRDDTAAVVFLLRERLQPMVDEFAVTPIAPDRRIADLQEELQAVRMLLKSKVEEIETANEELKSSNEEMMSMNEELQSANEELTTANEELKNKIDELTLANADLDNFMQSSDLAMVVLDRGLRIRHVTDAARAIFPIQRSDQGRSLTEFNISFAQFDLAKEIRQVMQTQEPFSQTTLPNEEGRSFFVRITPYFFGDGSVEGTSITLVDVTNEMRLRHDLAIGTAKLRQAMDAASQGFIELDVESGVAVVNARAAEHLGLNGAGDYDVPAVFENIHPEEKKAFADALERTVSTGERLFTTVRVAIDGQTRWFKVSATQYRSAEGAVKLAILGIDLTSEIEAQQRLELESQRLKLAMRAGRMGLAELDVDSGEVTVDEVLAEHLNLPRAGAVSMEELTANFVEEDIAQVETALQSAIEAGDEYEFDFRIKRSDKEISWIRTRGLLYTTADGRKKVVGPTLDITDQNAREMLVGEMSHRIKNLFAVISALVQMAPKEAEETKALARDLVDRIAALGAVYDLARKSAGQSGVYLGDLLATVLEPHTSSQEVTFDGPEVYVREDLLNTFTLIIHELTTNALKYGALSVPGGKLTLSWTVAADGQTQIVWDEETPDFTAPDVESGFGSMLIETGIEQLRGTFERDFAPTGTKIRLSARF